MLADRRLSAGHARALLAAPESNRYALAARAVNDGLTVRALELLATATPLQARATSPIRALSPEERDFEMRLRERFGTHVAVVEIDEETGEGRAESVGPGEGGAEESAAGLGEVKFGAEEGEEGEDGLAVGVIEEGDEQEHRDEEPFVVGGGAEAPRGINSAVREPGMAERTPFRSRLA